MRDEIHRINKLKDSYTCSVTHWHAYLYCMCMCHSHIVCVCVKIYAWAQRSMMIWHLGSLGPVPAVVHQVLLPNLGVSSCDVDPVEGEAGWNHTSLLVICIFLGHRCQGCQDIYRHLFCIHTMCESTIMYIYTHHRTSAYAYTGTCYLSTFAHMQHSSKSMAI